MTKGQRYALGHHLSEWPKEGMTFEAILELIESGDDRDGEILIWQPFENMSHNAGGEQLTIS